MNVNDLINKKFLELAVKAKIPNYVLEPGTELCLAPHLQEFAELIVRECAKIAEKEQAYNDMHDMHEIRVNIDQCILIEFGL